MTPTDKEPRDRALLQFSLRGGLVVMSLICVVSVVFPWAGVVLVAYLPVLLGFAILRHADRVKDETKWAAGVVLLGVGYILGTLILAAVVSILAQ
jgi:hypothetical protein